MARRKGTYSKLIRVSSSKIYEALLDPKALAHWLPPKGITGKVYRLEPVRGGVFRMQLTYKNAEGRGKSTKNSDIVVTRYLELVPNVRMVQAVRFDSDNPAFSGDMIVAWELGSRRGGTLVTVTCKNVPAGIDEGDHQKGLQSSLDNLAAYLQG